MGHPHALRGQPGVPVDRPIVELQCQAKLLHGHRRIWFSCDDLSFRSLGNLLYGGRASIHLNALHTVMCF